MSYTKDELEFLDKALLGMASAITISKKPIYGELATAAEAAACGLLIERRKLHAQAQPPAERQEQRVSNTYKFDDGLVERLADLLKREAHQAPLYKDLARAILTELATMDVDLPTVDELAAELRKHKPGAGIAAEAALESVRARIAPVLAAQKAEIEKWRSRAFEEQHTASVSAVESAGLRKELAEARAKIAELESRTPANEVQDAERVQYELTIEQQRRRIAGLEERIRDEQADREEVLDQRNRANLKAAELEKRLAEQTAPIDATGKTPGDVLQEAMRTRKQTWNDAAQAVLRAFGGEALRRMRERIKTHEIDVRTPGGREFAGVLSGNIFYVIDDEIAKLGAPATSHNVVVCPNCNKPLDHKSTVAALEKAFEEGRFKEI